MFGNHAHPLADSVLLDLNRLHFVRLFCWSMFTVISKKLTSAKRNK